jgi:hypothetical protein
MCSIPARPLYFTSRLFLGNHKKGGFSAGATVLTLLDVVTNEFTVSSHGFRNKIFLQYSMLGFFLIILIKSQASIEKSEEHYQKARTLSLLGVRCETHLTR